MCSPNCLNVCLCSNNISQILRISWYSELEDICETLFGSRTTVYRGKMPLRTLVQTEIAVRHPKNRTVILSKITKPLLRNTITVSADGAFRDDIVALLRKSPYSNINLAHAEYQPLYTFLKKYENLFNSGQRDLLLTVSNLLRQILVQFLSTYC